MGGIFTALQIMIARSLLTMGGIYGEYDGMYTKEIIAQQKSYGFKNLVKLGVENINFKITIGRTVFNFSYKTSVFAGLGALFE